MKRSGLRQCLMMLFVRVALPFAMSARVCAAVLPVVTEIMPAGAQAGRTTEVKLSGSWIENVSALHSNIPAARFEKAGGGLFRVSIPADTPPGFYDLWAVGSGGISAPLAFVVGLRNEILEPAKSGNDPPIVASNVTVNGRLATAGETDSFRFEARKGQRIVLECWAERIDSRLRGVLELFDANGRRLAANRGYFGKDPLIDWVAPSDGVWTVRLHDLTFGGGDDYVYRVDIGPGPRPGYASPGLVESGKPAAIRIFGPEPMTGNAARGKPGPDSQSQLRLIELPAERVRIANAPPLRRKVAQSVLEGFSLDPGESQMPLFVATGEDTAKLSDDRNLTPSSAMEIPCPAEIEGTLDRPDDQAWFALTAKHGEVVFFEAFGERIGSPVDLRIGIFDTTGKAELATFSDVHDSPETPLPIGHSDPVGRWVAPTDGRYLIQVRNLTAGPENGPRRVYRLSVRREEPDFRVVAAPSGAAPASLNVPAGGNLAFDLVALRRRGFDGPIRVFAQDLPSGIECPEVWIGPHTDCARMTISADREFELPFASLKLMSEAAGIGRRPVAPAAFVRAGSPVAEARLVSELAFAVAGEAPVRIEADAHRSIQHHLYGTLPPVHMPGGVVDVAVRVDRRDASFRSPVKLAFDGLPPQIPGRTSFLPAGVSEGWISLYLPPTLEPGRYSFLVRAETSASTNDPAKPVDVVTHSQPVTIDVKPAAFLVEADPFAVRKVKRGETFQIRYGSKRRNGFIGKMHTELAVPGIVTDVPGLRGRGETFVGQTDRGSLQIVVNDDAPLGPVPNLRLLTVGVIEDEPVLQGAVFLDLEIVE